MGTFKLGDEVEVYLDGLKTDGSVYDIGDTGNVIGFRKDEDDCIERVRVCFTKGNIMKNVTDWAPNWFVNPIILRKVKVTSWKEEMSNGT
jgi:hypothetical protein